MKYTKEEKQKYFKDLRARWKESKALADKDEVKKGVEGDSRIAGAFLNAGIGYGDLASQRH